MNQLQIWDVYESKRVAHDRVVTLQDLKDGIQSSLKFPNGFHKLVIYTIVSTKYKNLNKKRNFLVFFS